MPDLSTYTGKPLNAFATSFISLLEAEGFTIAPTGQGPKDDQRKTLRIGWRGFYIGQMTESLWGRRVPYACLYRFANDAALSSVSHAPPGFDKETFARDHRCVPDMLCVRTDSGKSYLWVRDAATGLHLMRDWARRIDEVFFRPKDRVATASFPEIPH